MIKIIRRHKRKLIGAAVIAVIGLVLFSLQIKTVEVKGNHQYAKEEIIDLVMSDPLDYHTVYYYGKNRLKKHRQIPFIEDYQIVFHSWSEIDIIVYEKSIVGYVSYMGNYMYFDKDGIVVESSSEKLDDVPEIGGLQFGHIVLYQKLPVIDESIFNDILNLTQILSNYDFQVDKIQYDDYKHAVLYIDDIDVILGDNQYINEKITLLSDTLGSLQGMSGILQLDSYDESNKKPLITFKRK